MSEATTTRQDDERAVNEASSKGVSLGFLTGLIGYHLRLAQLRVFDHFSATMKKSGDSVVAGVTPGLFRILLLVGENAGMNQSSLARAVRIDRSTLVPILNRLENLGLVERRPSDVDKRSHALHLTQKGIETVAHMQSLVLEHEAEIAAKLTDAERRTLLELLSKLS